MHQVHWDKIEKWKRWATDIHAEVEQLLLRCQVWSDLVEMIDENPEIQTRSVFYEWLPVVYTHTQVMAVRRMVDRDERAASLSNLIREIGSNPKTAQTHADKTPIMIDGQRIEREIPEAAKDWERVSVIYEPLKPYADMRIAHRDGRGFTKIPTYGDITAAIEMLRELDNRYCGFIMTEDYYDPEPVFAYPWQQIFTVPWIQPRDCADVLTDSRL